MYFKIFTKLSHLEKKENTNGCLNGSATFSYGRTTDGQWTDTFQTPYEHITSKKARLSFWMCVCNARPHIQKINDQHLFQFLQLKSLFSKHMLLTLMEATISRHIDNFKTELTACCMQYFVSTSYIAIPLRWIFDRQLKSHRLKIEMVHFESTGCQTLHKQCIHSSNDSTTSTIVVTVAATMRTTTSVYKQKIRFLKMSAPTGARTVSQCCPPYIPNKKKNLQNINSNNNN